MLDEETAEWYRSAPGALGKKLRREMRQDADGDLCFPLQGGRCPFLDAENLCEIHRTWGPEATSLTCREHPRFTEDYGPFREVTLSASCPAAEKLLLGSEEVLCFRELTTEEPEEEGDEWLPFLLPLRARLIALLQDRSIPLRLRMERFLLLAAAAQERLDEDMPQDLPELPLPEWTEEAAACGGIFPKVWDCLAELECLEEDWPWLLRQTAAAEPKPQRETLLERIVVYFAFRYLLKCVNDGDLLSRAQLCVFSVLTVERLAAVCGLPEALRRFSREIEHDEENLEALLEHFRFDPELGPEAFLVALRCS